MSDPTTKPKAVISFDVEATGDSPATASCNMIGMVVFLEDAFKNLSNYNGKEWILYKKAWCIKEYNPRGERCMAEFWSKHMGNLEHIEVNAHGPHDVARDISDFLGELSLNYDWYFVADPAAFDWQWLNSFYDKFGPSDKTYLGYKAICMDGMEQCLRFMGQMHNISIPDSANVAMTHFADDDAEYQAYYFMLLQQHIQGVKDKLDDKNSVKVGLNAFS
jgi:hypothetical protein